MKTKLLTLLAVLTLSFGCQAAQPQDGWRHTQWTPSTSGMYVKDDYVITRASEHKFVLIYRPDGQYVRIGEFKTLAEAKQAVK